MLVLVSFYVSAVEVADEPEGQINIKPNEPIVSFWDYLNSLFNFAPQATLPVGSTCTYTPVSKVFKATATAHTIGGACASATAKVKVFKCPPEWQNSECKYSSYMGEDYKVNGVSPPFYNLVVGKYYEYLCYDCTGGSGTGNCANGVPAGNYVCWASGLVAQCVNGALTTASTCSSKGSYTNQCLLDETQGSGTIAQVCKVGVPVTSCSFEGKTYQVGDFVRNECSIYDNTKIYRKIVGSIIGTTCALETETTQCGSQMICKDGECVKGETQKKNEGLTYEEIGDASNEELFLNSCTSKSECLSNKCLTFNSLIAKDILTEKDVENMLDKIEGQDYYKAITGGAFIGGGICAATGLGLIISPLCAVGGGVVGFLTATTVDAWSKQDPREVGVCIKEEEVKDGTGDLWKQINPSIWGAKIGKAIGMEEYGAFIGWGIVVLGVLILFGGLGKK